jgi:hypothetical protein
MVVSYLQVSRPMITSCNWRKWSQTLPDVRADMCYLYTLSTWIFCVLCTVITRDTLELTGAIWPMRRSNGDFNFWPSSLIFRESDKNQVSLHWAVWNLKTGVYFCAQALWSAHPGKQHNCHCRGAHNQQGAPSPQGWPGLTGTLSTTHRTSIRHSGVGEDDQGQAGHPQEPLFSAAY